MEKVLGPFNGFYIALYVRDLGHLGTSFLGQYKICRTEPADFFSADFIRSKCIEGISDTEEEAMKIALELARLQIGTFSRRLKAGARLVMQPEWQPRVIVKPSYAPTMPCPLYATPA